MKYTSQQQIANLPASLMYERLSNFENLSPIVASKVSDWQATADSCSFKAQGFALALRMQNDSVQGIDGSYNIKVVTESSPLPFTFWLQLKELTAQTTCLRVVAELELNAMFKMMLGNKLQEAVDKLAEQIAESAHR